MDIKVEGIQDLVGKIKKLDDKMTRREVLKIQRKLALPLVKAYREELPEQSGNLKRSVAAETVPGRKVDGNPQIVVRPSTKGKKNGYYRHMVVAKGAQLGSNKRGSRKGVNTVVDQARDSVVSKRNSLTTAKYEKQMTRFVQKQIDKLSK